jgi:peptide deformylase
MNPLVPSTDPILRQVAAPVTKFDEELESLIYDLITACASHNGVAIAAPQIGVLRRVIVLGTVGAMINPMITKKEGFHVLEEGCLSFPGKRIRIGRATYVEVEYFDMDGHRRDAQLTGLYATAVQHEIDHLDGILFIDHA